MADLQTAGIGFKAAFQGAFDAVKPDYSDIVMEVNSTTGKEEYGWLGALQGVREWLGDRVINKLATHGYQIRNRSFENTVSVKRDDVDDDNLGIYAPMFRDLGQTAAEFPSQLVYSTLRAGFSETCYDGQFFFDTDHQVLDANGVPYSVANTDAVAGNGEPWFLMCTARAVKPLIKQNRKAFQFVQKDKPTDDRVFMSGDYVYGVDGRMNVGFGLWQLAWGSKQPLNAANFETALMAMMSQKGDFGRPLGLKPDLIVTGPKNLKAAKELLEKERLSSGEDNIWRNEVAYRATPWLA